MTQKEVNTASNSSPWTVDCVTWTHTQYTVSPNAQFLSHTLFVILHTGSNTNSETTTPNFHEIWAMQWKECFTSFTRLIWLSLSLIFSETAIWFWIVKIQDFKINFEIGCWIRWARYELRKTRKVCTSSNKLWLLVNETSSQNCHSVSNIDTIYVPQSKYPVLH